MKLLLLIMSIFVNSVLCIGQNAISSIVTLTAKTDNAPATGVAPQSNATLILNDATSQFSASINIFPIVPNPDTEDSLAQFTNPLQLKLSGVFPVKGMDFLTTGDNGKNYIMNVSARLNNKTINVPLNFVLIIMNNAEDISNSMYPHYQAKMRFQLLLQPADFGLDSQPFAMDKLVMINADNAIINKDY